MSRLIALAVVIAGGYFAIHALETPARSAQAVCHVWDTQGLALHNEFAQSGSESSSDPLAALGDLSSAPGQIGDLMSSMATVAPSSIEPDFQDLAQAFNQVQSNEGGSLSDPLAALGGDLMAGLSTQQAADNVNQFLSANCGIPGESSASGG